MSSQSNSVASVSPTAKGKSKRPLATAVIAIASSLILFDLNPATHAPVSASGQFLNSPQLTSYNSPARINFGQPVSRMVINSLWGYRTDPIANQRFFHNGLDFDGAHGTPILASAAGTVEFAGTKSDVFNAAYGIHVIINHGNGYKTVYGHLSQALVSPGQSVQAGHNIGRMGTTGRSTGVHLHFEVRQDGAPADPLGLNTINPLPLLPQTFSYHPLATPGLLGGEMPGGNTASVPRPEVNPPRTSSIPPAVGTPQPNGLANPRLQSRCPANSTLLVTAETENYLVGICRAAANKRLRQDAVSFYVGLEKDSTSPGVTATVESEDSVTSAWTARNGPFTYTIDLSARQLIVRGPGLAPMGYRETIVRSQNNNPRTALPSIWP